MKILREIESKILGYDYFNWTIVRPFWISNEYQSARNYIHTANSPPGLFAPINREDIAYFILKECAEENYSRKEPFLYY